MIYINLLFKSDQIQILFMILIFGVHLIHILKDVCYMKDSL